MRFRDILFVLRDGENRIIAITEDKDLALSYINQFYDYFSTNGSSIEKITERHIVRQLLDNYVDIASLHSYSDNIILTQYEYDFYNIHFKKIYDEFKSTISSILTFKNYINLDKVQLELLTDTFKMMYDKCHTFDEFISNMNPEYIFKYIIMDPILSKDTVTDLEQLMIKMNYDISKDSI